MKIFLLILLLIYGGVLLSQPSITSIEGSFIHNTNITISGNNFGQKSPAGPIKWDDFESGTEGDDISGWTLTRNSNAANPVYPQYSNALLRAGSSMSVKCDFTNEQYNCSFGFDQTLSNYVYISYWTRIVDNGSIPPTNIKPMRIYGNYDDGNPVIGYTDQILYSWAFIWSHTENDVFRNLWDTVGADENDGQWHRYEYIMKQSTNNTADGIFKFRKDAQLRNDVTDAVHRVLGYDWSYLRIGHFWGGDSTAGFCYYDDVYVDESWARIEIGDNSVFNNCTHREIQIPVQWTNNEITFLFKAGDFSSGEQAYLFVVDAQGNSSSGVSIIIEQSYLRPSKVQGVRVTP